MQFIVPQFIDVESKIIGPISGRQFIILLVTVGLMFIEFRLFTLAFAAIAIFFTGTIGGVLAFGKVNGQAMHYFLLNLVQTLRRPSLKVWIRMPYQPEEQTTVVSSGQELEIKPMASNSRLAQMSLMVDTGGAYAGDAVGLPDEEVPQAHATEASTAQTINLRR